MSPSQLVLFVIFAVMLVGWCVAMISLMRWQPKTTSRGMVRKMQIPMYRTGDSNEQWEIHKRINGIK